MNHHSRFHKLMQFESIDRVPVVEWAPWWDQTVIRWKKEGLSEALRTDDHIKDYFQLDPYRHYWVRMNYPEIVGHGHGCIKDMDDYIKIRDQLYPEYFLADEASNRIKQWGELQKRGEVVFWITLEGFFWVPRVLIGIEEHLYSFYDKPALIHEINQDLVNYYFRILDFLSEICQVDFMSFAEDMSYNHGPMLSKNIFDEFLAPYYRQINPKLKEMGTIIFIDSDGLIDDLIPWCLDVGAEGFLPLEHQANVDIVALRETYPQLRLIGGFDKLTMNKGERAMRAEFERILPVMRQGGYLPSVDHQTPPEVSLEDYQLYLRLLNEYCNKAVKETV